MAVAPLMRRYSPYRISAVVLCVGFVPLLATAAKQLATQPTDLGWLAVGLRRRTAILGPLVLTNILWFTAVRPCRPVARDAVREPPAVLRRAVRAADPGREDHAAADRGRLRRRSPGSRSRGRRSRKPPSHASNISSWPRTDFMPIDDWDHLELWVGNAKQAAYFYEHAFGFTRTAYAGPETGVRDRASYVLEQGDIRLVLTSGLRERLGDRALRGEARRLGQGHRAPRARRARGVPPGRAARCARDRRAALGRGRVRARRARLDRHLRRRRPHVRQPLRVRGRVPAGLRRPALAGTARGAGVGLLAIDHVVGNVELGRMDVLGRVLRARDRAARTSSTSATTRSRPSTRR